MSPNRPQMAFLAAILSLSVAGAAQAGAEPLNRDGVYFRDCLVAAGNAYRIPAVLLVILLDVEGGRLGEVSPNTNGTVDIGPMQVNDIWLPKIAHHWATSERAAYFALRDNFCANVEAGAWILRMGLDEAAGDFWEGVAFYHSHNPDYKRTYLASVRTDVLRLQREARANAAAQSASPSPSPTSPHGFVSHERPKGN